MKKYKISIFLTTLILLSTGFLAPYLANNFNIIGIQKVGNFTISSKAYIGSWGTNGMVICITNNIQSNVTICGDGSGGAIMAWADARKGTNNYDIYAQKIDSNGQIIWTINGSAICTAIDNQLNPAICTDNAGGAIIAWEDNRNYSTTITDIYAQWIAANGTLMWDPNGTNICDESGIQNNIRILFNGTNGAIIVWTDYRGTNDDIYAQKIGSDGEIGWDDGGTVICNATGPGSDMQIEPSICTDGTGGAIIAWKDQRDDNDGDIYVQGIEDDKSLKWTINGVLICNAGTHPFDQQRLPSVCGDSLSGAIISWQDSRNNALDIFAQRIASNGTLMWATNGTPICTADNVQQKCDIVSTMDGGAIITWQDYRNSNWDIFAQRINSLGAGQWTGNGSTICSKTGDQESPKTYSDLNNGAFIAWYEPSSASSDIGAQWITSTGVIKWGTDGAVICSASGIQEYPVICSAGLGKAIIAWDDQRAGSTESDIYSQKITDGISYNQKLLIMLIIAMVMMKVPAGIIALFYMLVVQGVIPL